MPKWHGRCDLFGRRQAVRVERERIVVKTGEIAREVAFCLTSLGADEAGPEELLNLVRTHWQVENRVHYVRDFTYDEDRCRASVRNLPRNLAALSNAAISIVRVRGEFKYIPPANRHYAARPQDALDAILTADNPERPTSQGSQCAARPHRSTPMPTDSHPTGMPGLEPLHNTPRTSSDHPRHAAASSTPLAG